MTERAPADFTDFVERHSDALVHFAFWMTGNWQDAQDAVAESLAKAYLAWARIEHPDAYIHRLVVNRARSQYRAFRHEVLVADPPDAGLADPGPDALIARTMLEAALRRLPRRQRAVVVLRYCLDLPVTDVANLLHCSSGTVKSQSSKALAKLGQDPAIRAIKMTPDDGEEI